MLNHIMGTWDGLDIYWLERERTTPVGNGSPKYLNQLKGYLRGENNDVVLNLMSSIDHLHDDLLHDCANSGG